MYREHGSNMLRLALIGTLATASPAFAGDLPDLAFVGLHQAELTAQEQEALAASMVAAIDETGKARVLVAGQVASTIEGRESLIVDDGLAGPARQKLASGIELFNQAQWEAAIALLQEAAVELELTYPGRHDTEDLWQSWVYLGTARLQQGVEGVEEAMEAAASLAPVLAPDPALFPPSAVEAYAEAAERLALHPVTLTVKATEDAEAFVDGVSVGPVPAVVEGLRPGVHHVVVWGAEGRRGYQRVELAMPPASPAPEVPDEGEGSEPPPPPPPPTVSAPRAETVLVAVDAPWLGRPGSSRTRRSEQIGALYRALGTRAAGVELVLLGGIDGDALKLQLYHVARDAWSRSLEVPYEGSAADEALTTVPLLMNLVDRDGQLTSTSPSALALDLGTNRGLASLLLHPPPPLPLEEPKKRRTGLVVGVVAGVVAAAALGGGLAYAASQGDEPAPTTPTTPTPTPTGPVDGGSVVITF